MKSFSILRTNTGLSTNMKIVVTSNYDLFMESIDSSPELSISRLKKVRFNKDNYFDEMIPYFFRNIPSEAAFSIKYDNDNDNMYNTYDKQYDDLYIMGARNITENKNYTEEYEFFAPVYFEKGSFPNFFAIFRVDGPGLIDLTKDNFRSEIINKLKCVKIFDLTKNTPLGEWIDKNFVRNDLFPDMALDIDWRKDEFTRWYGIDYETGGYTYKSFFMNETFEYENTIFDLEKFIFDGWSKNGVVFPNIINLSFLFDDTPATKTSLRKWSLNRYYGFYLNNLDLVTSISPYKTPKLKDDIYIDSTNTLISSSSKYPFDDNKSDIDFTKGEYWVEYLGNFYKVEQYSELLPTMIGQVKSGSNISTEEFINEEIYKYRIISDINLEGKENLLNKNICFIDEDNYIIKYSDLSYFQIPDFDLADVWVIEIDGKYHNILKEDDKLKINTDYGFKFQVDKYTYYINEPDSGYSTIVNLIVDENNPPKKFRIFRLNFSDICDFDTSIVDTEFSKYEYEKEDDITRTDETKMYFPDLRTKSYPFSLDDYVYKGEVVNIPTSSEYTSNLETFRIVNNDLNELWRKNPIYCRWGFQKSISSNDYPYLLNNSNIFEDYNRTTNPFLPIPSRIERNLDYFYTVNSSTSSYIHHSLHVEDHINGFINTNFNFDVDMYLNISTYSIGTSSMTYSSDYFSYFFGKKTNFKNGEILKNTKKYSLFNRGDFDTPNITLFRGIKFSIFDIENIKYDGNQISNINLVSSNNFEDYKFSIILSDSNKNEMDWLIVDNWDSRQSYEEDSIVVHDDILYVSATSNGPINSIVNDDIAPYVYTHWSPSYYVSPTHSLLWIPTFDLSYPTDQIIYNSGEYYRNNPLGTVSFWSPYQIYGTNSIVIYKGNYWISKVSNNSKRPPSNTNRMDDINSSSNYFNQYWEKTSGHESISKWKVIPLWNLNKNYNPGNIVVDSGVVYTCISPSINYSTRNTTYWNRICSIEPDTDIIYDIDNNPIISLNDKYYIIKSNNTKSTLENGINIYINKRWKNILINISINDGTIKNISGSDRDDIYGLSLHQLGKKYTKDGLYSPINSKLTAINIINSINDITNKYGFTDYLNYIVINEDGSINSYNYQNMRGLNHMLKCDFPDEIQVRIDSLKYEIDQSPINILNPSKKLKGGIIDNLSSLNYYNELETSYKISKKEEFRVNDKEPQMILVDNAHGLINSVYNAMYRHSGWYSPIFYDIELFERPGITSSIYGNYKFDTELTNFGKTKQRIISKVNTVGNIMKLKNRTDFRSIYPMLDEFGYTVVDFFIFKSTWDYKYHIECINNTNGSNNNLIN